MGLFSRLTANFSRVVRDVAPIAQIALPIVAPGIGGFIGAGIAGALTDFGQAAPSRVPNFSSRPGQLISPGFTVGAPTFGPAMPVDPCQRPAFSAPFRARFNPSGGSPAGRDLAFFNTFQPRSAVGRQVVPRCPPSGACECPGATVADPRVAAIAASQGLNSAQQEAVARFTNFSRNRFGRRI